MWKGLLAFFIVIIVLLAVVMWLFDTAWDWVVDTWDTFWDWLWSWLPWNWGDDDDDSFRGRREKFVSPRARMIAAAASETFSSTSGGDAGRGRSPTSAAYSQLRERLREVGGLDPVEFDDIRKLAHRNKLTPENVQQVLA